MQNHLMSRNWIGFHAEIKKHSQAVQWGLSRHYSILQIYILVEWGGGGNEYMATAWHSPRFLMSNSLSLPILVAFWQSGPFWVPYIHISPGSLVICMTTGWHFLDSNVRYKRATVVISMSCKEIWSKIDMKQALLNTYIKYKEISLFT